MWSKQNRMENSSPSDLLPPHPSMPLMLGTLREHQHPWGPWPRCGEVENRAVQEQGHCALLGHSMAAPSNLSRAPLSSSVKLYFPCQEFGLIYIHKHIDQRLYLHRGPTQLVLLPQGCLSCPLHLVKKMHTQR